MCETDSRVEGSDLILSNFVLGQFLLQPRWDKLLRLFQGNLIGIINGDIKSCNSVGDDGDTSTHLAWTNDTEGLDMGVMWKEFLKDQWQHLYNDGSFSVDIIIKSDSKYLYWLQFCIADDLIQFKFIQLMKVINLFAKLVINHQKVIIL